MGRQPRQRPVSCHFCRVRKLRCSRDFPCSNCTSRGVSCREPQDPPRASAPAPRPITKKTATGASAGEKKEKEADILSRLERLEALLAQQNKQPAIESQSSSTLPSISEADPPPRPRQDSQLALPLNVQNLTDDALWLDRTCLGPKASVGPHRVFITFPEY